MSARVAFITIGQAPRVDLVPELVRAVPTPIEAVEIGALDGFTDPEIAALAPRGSEARLVTRLAHGGQAVVAKTWVEARLAEILRGLDPGHYAATVLLCTGEFRSLERLDHGGLFLDAQTVVDHGTAAIAHGAQRIGVLVPLAEQTAGFHYRPRADQTLTMSFASPYEGHRLEQAARELRDADVIVMHCMGYTEAMRVRVVRAFGRPVLLARRMVAAALAQVL